MQRNSGFTLAEMLITVAVLALVTAIAVPSFQGLIRRNNLAATANDLVASVLTARSEAVKREREGRVVKAGADWSDGWKVEAEDPDNADVFIEVGVLNPSYGDLVITANGNAAAGIAFNSNGRSKTAFNSTDDYFELTIDDTTRYVCLSSTGRAYVKEDACP